MLRVSRNTLLASRELARTHRIDGLPFQRIEGDVRDRARVDTGIFGCDAVIHLASLSSWELIESPDIEAVIIDGTRNILDAAGPGVRVVHVSSVAAIGATSGPTVQDETATYQLDEERGLTYAQAKRRAEILCHVAVKRGADVVIVNPAETYGPDDTDLVTAGNLIDFAKGAVAFVCRGGTCLAHVDDVAAGIVAALERGRKGERYILGGENLSHHELARLFLELAGLHKTVVSVPNPVLRSLARLASALRLPLPFDPNVVPYATRYWFVDSGKAVHELGVPFRSARATLQPTVEWLREAGYIQ